jgi:hypothetical protein
LVGYQFIEVKEVVEIVEEGMKKWLYEHQKGIMRFLDGS